MWAIQTATLLRLGIKVTSNSYSSAYFIKLGILGILGILGLFFCVGLESFLLAINLDIVSSFFIYVFKYKSIIVRNQ